LIPPNKKPFRFQKGLSKLGAGVGFEPTIGRRVLGAGIVAFLGIFQRVEKRGNTMLIYYLLTIVYRNLFLVK
jgi:hypothetical protein